MNTARDAVPLSVPAVPVAKEREILRQAKKTTNRESLVWEKLKKESENENGRCRSKKHNRKHKAFQDTF